MNKAVNHRNMRILLILILSIFSFSFCFKVASFENTSATEINTPLIEVESKEVHRGQTFTIDVNLSNNNLGLISLLLTLDYDKSVMKLTNIVEDDALDSLTLTPTNPDTEEGYGVLPFNILWDGSTQDFTNGKIITFVFDSYIDAEIYEEDEKNYYDVTLTFDKQNTNTQYKTPIDVDIINGKVHLIKGEYQAIYRDHDGTVLFEHDYNDDENNYPEYPYENPFREEDEKYSYEFIKWKGAPSDDKNTLIFEAEYKLTPKIYTIFYYIDGIKGYPDGVIDQNDFFVANEISFGTYIEFPNVPAKQFYEFFGWYEDKNFSSVSPYALMPSEDITLYAYYKFDIREENIPIISLEDVIVNDEDENNIYAVVSAKILKNSGFNNMVLTLKYDNEVLEFEKFEKSEILLDMDLTVTGTDISEDFFKFYYNAGKNNYEIGEFLKLYFKVKKGTPDGVYDVWFEYDYHQDASYYANDTEIKYTKLEFYKGEVPIGLKYHWNTNLSTDRGVDMTSEDGKPMNVFLEVDLVTDKVEVDENLVETHVGDNMFMSSAYEIKLVQNRKEVQPNTTLTIKIKLTEKEQKSNIKFYYLNDNFELVSYDFKIENGELIFTTNHLSNWVIFSDYQENGGNNNSNAIFGSRGNAVIMIAMPLLLATATMLYALRLRQQLNKKNKEAHND